MSLLTLLKGLPMTYNRDLQEDKERLFDSADTVRAAARLMAAMLQNTTVNRTACAAAASDPALLATDLADYLVRKGMPFRQAHHAGRRGGGAGRENRQAARPIVACAIAVRLTRPLAATRWTFSICSSAMAQRNLTGAPGTREVAKQLARWRKQLT